MSGKWLRSEHIGFLLHLNKWPLAPNLKIWKILVVTIWYFVFEWRVEYNVFPGSKILQIFQPQTTNSLFELFLKNEMNTLVQLVIDSIGCLNWMYSQSKTTNVSNYAWNTLLWMWTMNQASQINQKQTDRDALPSWISSVYVIIQWNNFGFLTVKYSVLVCILKYWFMGYLLNVSFCF